MTSPLPATIGELLASADARFAAEGGWRADAFAEARRIDLIRRGAAGAESIISSADWPDGMAPEDLAGDLLSAEIGQPAATAEYFVITIR